MQTICPTLSSRERQTKLPFYPESNGGTIVRATLSRHTRSAVEDRKATIPRQVSRLSFILLWKL